MPIRSPSKGASVLSEASQMLCSECTETQATQSSKEKVLFRGRGCCDEVLFVIEYMYHIYLSKQWGAFLSAALRDEFFHLYTTWYSIFSFIFLCY